ncbi:MAG: DUF2200 family protein [Lachnospiraceae bacterium]|jgi:hypothetical protein|nr:DUF2200 family protein [Lachnospiraceae bacterium]MDY2944788.1 DUF2200 family protein [Lachnospiraceae bacterium]MDY6342180.1 DUF2200 family protein [Lachnospiraceae bacterium]
MGRQNVFEMKVSKIYPLLAAKAMKKGRTQDEVDRVIFWLTGWNMHDVDMEMSYGDFLADAPAFNPHADLIRGSICGVKLEEIEDPLTKRMRQLDKLIDELSKGKPMDKIVRG